MDVDEQDDRDAVAADDDDEDGGRLKVPKKRGKASGQIKSACVFPLPPPLLPGGGHGYCRS